jgi:hypothetical protein
MLTIPLHTSGACNVCAVAYTLCTRAVRAIGGVADLVVTGTPVTVGGVADSVVARTV